MDESEIVNTLRRVTRSKLQKVTHRSTTQLFEAFRVRTDGTLEAVYIECFDRSAEHAPAVDRYSARVLIHGVWTTPKTGPTIDVALAAVPWAEVARQD